MKRIDIKLKLEFIREVEKSFFSLKLLIYLADDKKKIKASEVDLYIIFVIFVFGLQKKLH